MLYNVFDLKAQYKDLYSTVGYDKAKLSIEQEKTMYNIFMSGASLMFELLVNGIGDMEEEEAIKMIEYLKSQLDKIFQG